MSESLRKSREHWKLLARSVLPVEVSKLAVEQNTYKESDVNEDLEQPIIDVINRVLKPKLGIDNVVEVIGLDAAVKLAHALKDVPVQTHEKVVYIPRERDSWPTVTRPWWEGSPTWVGGAPSTILGDLPPTYASGAGYNPQPKGFQMSGQLATTPQEAPVTRGDPE